ncbi:MULTISPECIES: hypothetical protein [Pseudoalteromonas]|uniref:hypothetical protein n=1 Tax=Pseudoalteromonas TaxID=53246 RepID=UPI0002F42FEF|nr:MULTISPECIES: hypothetical protein [Pseudoalteromonas]MCF6145947.1 hypothetical protein [Pseudoalteromonas mariniglutinosa NCIMB 1770]BDF95612.1 hypothetical protein KAN5_24500 [Pseudoalteromonas sp. KAN5]
MANLESLFEQWLEGNVLSDAQLQQLENDPEYRALMSQALVWQQHSREYKAAPVPHWDRQSTMPQLASAGVFGMAGAWAVAASVMICALVFLVMPKQQVPDLLEQVAKQTQLLESQQKQIDQLQKIITAQNELQQQHMYQLAKEAIATGRVERQEDINNLISYIKTQRAQDQAYLRMQLNDLAEQVQEQPMAAIAKN